MQLQSYKIKFLILPLMLIFTLNSCAEEEDEEDSGSNSNELIDAIALTEIAISIDGDASDWLAVETIFSDPVGDQNGNSSTDLVSFKAAYNADTFYLLMETSGSIAFPHTPTAEYSHYEVGLHFFTDLQCSEPVTDSNFIIANNFTSGLGENFHSLDDYIAPINPQDTVFAASTNYLETSFTMASFPENAQSMDFNPYIQSGPPYTQHDNAQDQDSICYVVPG